MAKRSEDKLMLAEHILEIRHSASGSFLDVKGFVADYIRDKKLFPHWKIDPNIVNFRDDPEKVVKDGAFAGYKNAGYVVFNPDTRNYFIEKAAQFWKALAANDHYTLPELTRFGARTKIFVPSTLPFDEINKRVFETLFTEKAKEIIGGKETDVQFTIDLTEEQFDVHLSGGPMHEKEANKHMSFESEHFKSTGLFLDMDYYRTKDLSIDIVYSLLKKAVELTWSKAENIATSLGI